MFDIESEITFQANVNIHVPSRPPVTVKASYRVLSQDALEASTSDTDLLEACLISVEGLSRGGEPITDAQQSKEAAMGNSFLVAGLAAAYGEARQRNFQQGKQKRNR